MMILSLLLLSLFLSLPGLILAIPDSTNTSSVVTMGAWVTMAGNTGVVCIHTALLPNNKLLCLERPHTFPYPILNPNTNGWTSVEMDLNSATLSPVVNYLSYNAFCAGHAQAKDGSIWFAGGDPQSSNRTNGITFLVSGIDRLLSYTGGDGTDAGVGTWTDLGIQPGGKRWYPTVVTLGNGDISVYHEGRLQLISAF